MLYKLPLDDELDKDIIDWIASFPRNRKTVMVRDVLRAHINGETLQVETPPVQAKATKAKVEKPIKEKPVAVNEDKRKNRFSNYNTDDIVEEKAVDLSGMFSS